MTEQEIYLAIQTRFPQAVVRIVDPGAKPSPAPATPNPAAASASSPTVSGSQPAVSPAVSMKAPVVRPKPLGAGAVARGCIELKPEHLREVILWLRDDAATRLDLPHCLSGVDYKAGEPLGVVYHFTSLAHKHWAVLKIAVPRDKPTAPSIADIFPAMNWHEREAFDLVGIVFEGHPDLRRILCAEDWEGHPLRKDYKFPETYHGVPTAKEARWNS